jgi:predicted nuclease of restriction endonuclease-like (RecB) superfamily
MNEDNTFQHLVNLCLQTDEALRRHAARAIDLTLVTRNWHFGRHIVEFEQSGSDRADYGTRLIPQLSETLTNKRGKGFSPRTLELYRKFYQCYPEISQTLSAKLELSTDSSDHREIQQMPSVESISDSSPLKLQKLSKNFPLSWSHYVALLSVANPDERSFYEIESTANDWSLRELKRQINSSLFERLALSRDTDQVKALAQQGQIVEQAADLVKNPYVLEFLGLDERTAYSESDLETAIIDKLEHFLLELGKGFLFEARQKRFTFDEDHYFIDLVFYHRLLRCYALIDLKIGEITHQDLGQMQMYVNYYDQNVKTDAEAPTIGIVLCKRKKDALVEITLPKDSNIHASEYKLYLPSKDELIAQIDQAAAQMEDQS